MPDNDRAALLSRYRAGTDAVMAAVREIAEDRLDVRGAPDEWTVREIIHHLADSEIRSVIRLRQLIAEDDPVIAGYDEARYAKTLHYDRPVGSSLEAMAIARRVNLELVERLTEDEWARTGTHTEDGPYGVAQWLAIYAAHPHDHAAQIRRAGTAPA